eukprot:2747032-Rhodomonas_salina.1
MNTPPPPPPPLTSLTYATLDAGACCRARGCSCDGWRLLMRRLARSCDGWRASSSGGRAGQQLQRLPPLPPPRVSAAHKT